MSLGAELREARERLGLSREHISSTTKIQLPKIAALEEGRFDELPGGIYLDGIAAAYARAVGLDPADLVRQLRAFLAPPAPPTLEEIATVRKTHDRESVMPLRFTPAQGMGAFAVVASALAVLGVGVHLVPPQSTPLVEQTVARSIQTRGADLPARSAEPTRSAEPGRSVEPVRSVEPPHLEARGIQIPEVITPSPLAVSDDGSRVAGVWRLETTIESSSVRTFKGLRLGYQLELRQDDDRVVGTGVKVTENGVTLKRGRQTPIAVSGTIDGGHLSLVFGERGARRASQGRFNLVLEKDRLRGDFSSDAARSAGIVKASRI